MYGVEGPCAVYKAGGSIVSLLLSLALEHLEIFLPVTVCITMFYYCVAFPSPSPIRVSHDMTIRYSQYT
jgi:hypothetical protein